MTISKCLINQTEIAHGIIYAWLDYSLLQVKSMLTNAKFINFINSRLQILLIQGYCSMPLPCQLACGFALSLSVCKCVFPGDYKENVRFFLTTKSILFKFYSFFMNELSNFPYVYKIISILFLSTVPSTVCFIFF